MTRTAIGFEAPKLMTWLTMSPGSKPKVHCSACCLRLRLGQAARPSALLQPLGQPGDHPLGEDLAEPLAKLVELDAAVLLQA